MGVGHAALALGAAKAAPRLNVGWLVFAAFLADFLLGIFAAMGLERAHVPPDYASRHYLTFTFPYSHGLVPLIVWGAIFGFLISRLQRTDRTRIAIVAAFVVLSHFLLDGLVHVAGLPLLGENSPKFGLALWNHMPLELSLETLMTLVGLVIYLRTVGAAAPAVSRWGIPIFMALLAALTWTQLFATTPPQPAQLIPSWIVVPLVLSAIPYALDRKRIAALAPAS
jgi:hypothetical protein